MQNSGRMKLAHTILKGVCQPCPKKTVQLNGEAGGKTRKCRYACAKACQGDLRNPEGFCKTRCAPAELTRCFSSLTARLKTTITCEVVIRFHWIELKRTGGDTALKIIGERMRSLRESVRRCHGFCHRIPCCGCAAKKDGARRTLLRCGSGDVTRTHDTPGMNRML